MVFQIDLGSMKVDKQLEEIEQIPVDVEKARRYRSNRRFLGMSFSLLRETAQIAYLCSITTQKEAWNTNEAIIGGNTVRLVKLAKFVLQVTRDRQAEIFWVVVRLLVETAINIRYLIEQNSEELFQAYLYRSLAHEMELEKEIRQNIEERGQEWPIETRMLKSINLTYDKSGGRPSKIESRRKNKWAALSLYKKFETLEMQDLYDTIYGAPSRNIHGGWHDLLQHHLKWREEDGFVPKYSNSHVRPQLLFVIPKFVIPAVRDNLAFFRIEWPLMVSRLSDLEERIAHGDQLHEKFLSKRRT